MSNPYGPARGLFEALGMKPVLNDRVMPAPPEACDDYTRPEGVLGGSCSRCGQPQPAHAARRRTNHVR